MRPGLVKTVMMKMMGTGLAQWFGLNAGGDIDIWLLTKTNGRLALLVGWPIGLLETRGAKTGVMRKHAVMYLEDRGRLILVASKGGDPRNPAWLHNLKANPHVGFRWKGRNRVLTARIANADERPELWTKALELYPGYSVYQQRSGAREIPLVILEGPTGR
jgi:deazaflavin-dependent oxidoreductase (nitroreductase family)